MIAMMKASIVNMQLEHNNDNGNKTSANQYRCQIRDYKQTAYSSQLGSQLQGSQKVKGVSITCSDQTVMFQADRQLWRDKTCPALMSWKLCQSCYVIVSVVVLLLLLL